MKGVIVGRHINGITINPLEYLLEDETEDSPTKVFPTQQEAEQFLRDNGATDTDMYYFIFQEIEVE